MGSSQKRLPLGSLSRIFCANGCSSPEREGGTHDWEDSEDGLGGGERLESASVGTKGRRDAGERAVEASDGERRSWGESDAGVEEMT